MINMQPNLISIETVNCKRNEKKNAKGIKMHKRK